MPKQKKSVPPTMSIEEEPTKQTDLASLEVLVKQNIQWSQSIFEKQKKIQRRLTIMVVAGYLKLFLILAPLIVAFFYLPPLLKELYSQYGDFLGGTGGVGSANISDVLGQLTSGNIEGLSDVAPPQIQELLRSLGQ
jgi:hypothetical protein